MNNNDNYKLDDFLFGYTTTASVFTGDFEGIIGLAYPGLNKSNQSDLGAPKSSIPPFFD